MVETSFQTNSEMGKIRSMHASWKLVTHIRDAEIMMLPVCVAQDIICFGRPSGPLGPLGLTQAST